MMMPHPDRGRYPLEKEEREIRVKRYEQRELGTVFEKIYRQVYGT